MNPAGNGLYINGIAPNVMVYCETDPAWWAIVVSYSMVLGFTLGIGLRDNRWDTISEMVARADLTLHGFAMVTLAMVVCQVYWIRLQIERWTKKPAEGAVKSSAPWLTHPFTTAFIALGAIGSTVGTLGFGVVSQNLSNEDHIRFAGVAFTSALLYLAGFLALSKQTDRSDTPDPLHAATFLLALAAVSLVMLWQDKGYGWEYVLVTALHGGALALTRPNAHPIFYNIAVV